MFKFSLMFLIALNCFAHSKSRLLSSDITYKPDFGGCPSKSAGKFLIAVMKEFEKEKSLLSVKREFLKNKWDEKYFLSDYKISYNPVRKEVGLRINCPVPLVKVQIYKDNGKEHYSAILVDNGKLFDPSYEFLLKTEKQLKGELPRLAIPVELLEGEIQNALTVLTRQMEINLRGKISELIVDENRRLTIIFNFNRRPTSVFLGPDQWDLKLKKLSEIVEYVKKSNTYPSTINLTNAKKVVVKF